MRPERCRYKPRSCASRLRIALTTLNSHRPRRREQTRRNNSRARCPPANNNFVPGAASTNNAMTNRAQNRDHALASTIEHMRLIDEVIEAHGGFPLVGSQATAPQQPAAAGDLPFA